MVLLLLRDLYQEEPSLRKQSTYSTATHPTPFTLILPPSKSPTMAPNQPPNRIDTPHHRFPSKCKGRVHSQQRVLVLRPRCKYLHNEKECTPGTCAYRHLEVKEVLEHSLNGWDVGAGNQVIHPSQCEYLVLHTVEQWLTTWCWRRSWKFQGTLRRTATLNLDATSKVGWILAVVEKDVLCQSRRECEHRRVRDPATQRNAALEGQDEEEAYGGRPPAYA